eukprot:1560304-Prymnesium_polylepis.1
MAVAVVAVVSTQHSSGSSGEHTAQRLVGKGGDMNASTCSTHNSHNTCRQLINRAGRIRKQEQREHVTCVPHTQPADTDSAACGCPAFVSLRRTPAWRALSDSDEGRVQARSGLLQIDRRTRRSR